MRKSDEDSSLELLLDTMCNTFGSVMFIAISLAVVIFGQQAVTKSQPPPPEEMVENAEELRKEIQSLKAELTKRSKNLLELQSKQEDLKQDPRLQLLKEIAVMEMLLKNAKMAESIQQKELKTLNVKFSLLAQEKEKWDKEVNDKNEFLAKKLEEILKAERENKDLEGKIAATSPLSMSFYRMQTSQREPYFLILKEGKLWQVGPENVENGKVKNHSSVKTTAKKNQLLCEPIPGKGIQLFSGENLGSESMKLLQKLIAANRIPHFVLDSQEAESFYKLREVLKKSKIKHGFSFYEKIFTYFTSTEGSYEF